eukprot:1551311-Rhodomonas_salina.1
MKRHDEEEVKRSTEKSRCRKRDKKKERAHAVVDENDADDDADTTNYVNDELAMISMCFDDDIDKEA